MSSDVVTRERPRTCPVGQSLTAFADHDPFGFYEEQRRRGSPVWDEQAQGWLVLDYEQCAAAERDETRFANAYIFADATLAEVKGGGANITLSRDAEHMRLRKLHLKLLSPASVERFRVAHVVPVVDELLDRIEGRGHAELVAALAEPVPPRVICRLLGMPDDDAAMIARILLLNEEIVRLIASGYRDLAQREKALAASAELNAMLLPYIRARRERPADDFISRVWQDAPEAGIKLDESGALGLCRELYFAGSDTTVHGIANALYMLLSRPELMEAVRADRTKALAALVEESLRLLNVVQFRHRICIENATIGDVEVKRGEAIFLVHAAANRDPEHYACPADIDITRRAPTDHLAFGKGTRSCVGAQLARVEMREVLSRALDRLPNLRLDPDAPKPVFRGLFMRSMAPLHVRFGESAP